MRAYYRAIPGLLAMALVAAVMTMPTTAAAQDALMDDDDDDDIGRDDAPTAAPVVEDPNAPAFGVGLRLRQTFIPTSIIEAFVERAEGGHSNFGIGIEGIRRRGDLEISFGIEYESLAGDDGIWIDNDLAADLLEYEGFGWITGDFTFVWHTKLHEYVALRYGGGAGLGIILGDVLQTDYICNPPDSVGSCNPDPGGEDMRTPQDKIPPVFPVVNILAGVQIRPTKNIAINVEGGMRTVFYFGSTVAYFF
ncbi:MAG TPA: hypothetical protein VML75_14055 [Kofleriaceae bacterium]|nr:hypothetical protein [Kofleriaceae bacterium]